jgi:hypothetical protein
MNPIYIQSILSKIYGDFREVVAKIRGAFLVNEPPKRRKVENSMSVSHISEIGSPFERRPSKE